MKLCLSLLLFVLSLNAMTQSVCGTANEGGSVTLTAPAGNVFTSVTFASYGTPNGTCGSFTIGTCHAANSQTIVETALIGNSSATIPATNGVFGDPCGGTVKRLYIEAVYSSSLPLHLLSYSCTPTGNSNLLRWETTDEINTQAFAVERSADGLYFSVIASIPSRNTNGNNHYGYTDYAMGISICFYRLKMIDQDGSFTYSKVIKTETTSTGQLKIFPNPVTNSVSITGWNVPGYIEITTVQGTVLQRIPITGSRQHLDLSRYPAGLYLLRYATDNKIQHLKLVKQ